MRLIRAKNYDDMSLKAANIIAAQVSLNPKSVLGLATGSTPIGTYRHYARRSSARTTARARSAAAAKRCTSA